MSLGISHAIRASVLAVCVTGLLQACGGGGGGGSSGGDSTINNGSSSDANVSPGATASVLTSANNRAYWNLSVTTQFSLRDASGNVVAGPYTCASDSATTLTVVADCSSITGKRLGQQGVIVSGGGVSAKATVKVIPQPQPIGAHGGGEAGTAYSLVVTTDGRVLGWGMHGGSGALGQWSSTSSSSLPIAVNDPTGKAPLTGIVAVSAGQYAALALTEDGEVYSWGGDNAHQLGRGIDGPQTSLPGKVLVFNSGNPSPPLQHIVAISISNTSALALSDDGTVYTWGTYTGLKNSNGHDVLYQGTATPMTGVGATGNLTGVVAISDGGFSRAALLDDGRVVTWGMGLGDPCLGHGTPVLDTVVNDPPSYVVSETTGQPITDAVAIAMGERFGLLLTATGKAYGWGLNDMGQLGNGQDANACSAVQVLAPSGLVMIAAARNHGLALDSGGFVYSWGSGVAGQLGDGENQPRGLSSPVPARVVNLGGTSQPGSIASIAGGNWNSMALTNDGRLQMWGEGYENLAQGSKTTPNSPIPLSVKNEAGTGLLNLGPTSYWPNLTQRAQ